MRLFLLGLCTAGLTAIGLGACSPAPLAQSSASTARATAAAPPHAAGAATPRAAGSHGCVAVPHSCGYPDATNTGIPAGMTLQSVPSQISHGPGWQYNPLTHEVDVTGYDTTLKGLYIPYLLNITASKVTITDDRIVHAGFFGISLRHTAGVTITHSVINGLNETTGRLGSAICDLYGDSTGVVLEYNNISDSKTAVQISAGLVSSNYIHNFGYMAGDHLNGVFDVGTTQPLIIYHNTILNNFGQTDAINLDASNANEHIANKTIEGNLLGGGSFTIYGGNVRNAITSGIVIEDNRFSQLYYSKSGQYGPVAYYATNGSGNAWSGNVWDTTGQPVAAP